MLTAGRVHKKMFVLTHMLNPWPAASADMFWIVIHLLSTYSREGVCVPALWQRIDA